MHSLRNWILLSCFLAYTNIGFTQTQAIVDSLRGLFEQEQPGPSKLDYLLGIGRCYIFLSDELKTKEAVQLGYQLAREYKDKAAESNFKVMENMIAFIFEAAPDKAIALCEEAAALAEESGDKDAMAFAYYQLAENYTFEKRDYTKAIEILNKSIAQLDSTVTLKTHGNTYKNLGIANARLGNYPEAIQAFEKSIEYLETVVTNPDKHPKLGRVSAMYADGGYNNLGQVLVYYSEAFQNIGDLDQAEKILQRDLELVERYDNLDMIYWVTVKLGALYKKKGDYAKAIEYLRRGIDGFASIDKDRDVLEQQLLLGQVFVEMEEYDQAIATYQESYNYFEQKKDSVRMLDVATNQSDVLLRVGKVNEAQEVLDAALEIASNVKDKGQLILVRQRQSRILNTEGKYQESIDLLKEVLALAEERKDLVLESEALLEMAQNSVALNQLEEGIRLGEKSLEKAQVIQRKDLKAKANAFLAQTQEQAGNFQVALQHYKSYQTYQDSLSSERTQEIFRAEQVRQNVQTYKDQQEIAQLQAAALASRNRQYLTFALGLLGILLIGGYLFIQLRRTKSQLESQNGELKELNQTKDRFFGIIAHDIRSPMIALDGVGKQMDFHLHKGNTDKLQKLSELIDRTAGRLNALLDNLLNWALLQTKRLPFNPEPLAVKPMVDRVVALFTPLADLKNIEIAVDVSEELSVYADESGFQTILRNLLSNALKFTPQDGKVSLSAQQEEGQIYFYLKDTGVGIPSDKIDKLFTLDKKSSRGTDGEKGTGLGLILCKELIETHQGKISIESQENQGTHITFSIPNR